MDKPFRIISASADETGLRNNISSVKSLIVKPLDLSTLIPGQTLTILFSGHTRGKKTRISFFITRESGEDETRPLIGEISGCNLNEEMKNACVEKRLPVPPIGTLFAINGSCETYITKIGAVAINTEFNFIYKAKNLHLLARPFTQGEEFFTPSCLVLGWLISY